MGEEAVDDGADGGGKPQLFEVPGRVLGVGTGGMDGEAQSDKGSIGGGQGCEANAADFSGLTGPINPAVLRVMENIGRKLSEDFETSEKMVALIGMLEGKAVGGEHSSGNAGADAEGGTGNFGVKIAGSEVPAGVNDKIGGVHGPEGTLKGKLQFLA